MGALTKDRNTPERAGAIFSVPMAAGAKIYAGSLVCLNASGYAVPGSTSTTLTAIGRAEEQADNSAGEDGDLRIKIQRGIFRFENSSGDDEISLADVGGVGYVVDDQTVAKTSDTNTRSRGGYIVDVDDLGVWLLLGYGLLADPSGALAAANNLSDLASAATARSNLGGGADKVVMQMPDIDLVGANTQVKYIAAPVAGDIASIRSVIDGALTTGDATLTAAINGTPVTGGVITIAQDGSAAGDVDAATPTAAKTVAAGGVISITVGGTNDAEKLAQVAITITPSA